MKRLYPVIALAWAGPFAVATNVATITTTTTGVSKALPSRLPAGLLQ